MKPSPIYETERLILKPVTKEDAEFILKLLNTPKWLQFIGDRNVNSIKDASKYIETKMIPQYQELGYGNYMVIRKSDQQKMGNCGIYNRKGLDGVDIGFAFLPEFEKKGYAFEASLKVKDMAINQFNIKQLKGITTKENLASQKLLEKLGFSFTKLITILNDNEELMLYQLKK